VDLDLDLDLRIGDLDLDLDLAVAGLVTSLSINQSIYLFQTTRIHSKQRTDDRKVTEYTNETDRNTFTGV